MAYKYLNRSAVLEHLQEGQTVNIDEYIEKLRFFKKYTDNQGTYITDRRMAAIDAMDRTYNNPSTPRRTRFELSIELPIQREALKNYHNERSRVSAELRGLRTAIDLILTVSNYGGEVTPGNRRLIESILI